VPCLGMASVASAGNNTCQATAVRATGVRATAVRATAVRATAVRQQLSGPPTTCCSSKSSLSQHTHTHERVSGHTHMLPPPPRCCCCCGCHQSSNGGKGFEADQHVSALHVCAKKTPKLKSDTPSTLVLAASLADPLSSTAAAEAACVATGSFTVPATSPNNTWHGQGTQQALPTPSPSL